MELSQDQILQRLGQKDLQLFWYEMQLRQAAMEIARLTAEVSKKVETEEAK